MNIKLITVGAVKEPFYRNKIEEFTDKLSGKHNLQSIQLKDESIPKNAGDAVMSAILEREGDRILSNISNTDYLIALCIDGNAADGAKLKQIMERGSGIKTGYVTLVIGGSLGLSKRVTDRADYKLSFSKMTFPHQLMRLMLLEQLVLYL
jgi:23S rRNA (pseudouridine1915-N3)-methyltransferase